jgi:hypothetical protein
MNLLTNMKYVFEFELYTLHVWTIKCVVTLYSYFMFICAKSINCICRIMVSVLASSAVDREFEPRSGQTKDYNIVICCFSAKHAALRRKSKDWLTWDRTS